MTIFFEFLHGGWCLGLAGPGSTLACQAGGAFLQFRCNPFFHGLTRPLDTDDTI